MEGQRSTLLFAVFFLAFFFFKFLVFLLDVLLVLLILRLVTLYLSGNVEAHLNELIRPVLLRSLEGQGIGTRRSTGVLLRLLVLGVDKLHADFRTAGNVAVRNIRKRQRKCQLILHKEPDIVFIDISGAPIPTARRYLNRLERLVIALAQYLLELGMVIALKVFKRRDMLALFLVRRAFEPDLELKLARHAKPRKGRHLLSGNGHSRALIQWLPS